MAPGARTMPGIRELLVAPGAFRRKCRYTHGDVFRPIGTRRAIADPLALVCNDALPGPYLQHPTAMLDSHQALQHDGVLVENRLLARLAPTWGTGHVRDAEGGSK